jgi:adenine deaminase
MPDPHVLAVARGDRPADIVLKGGRVVNVFTGEVEAVDVALAGPRVAGLGPGYHAEAVVELEGSFVVPGLIDAHVHIESSLVTPPQFARAVVPRGTTTVVCDPHEIANVHGLEGVRYMLAASEGLPLSVFVMASSCVPATEMSTSGAELDVNDLLSLRDQPGVLGLAEVMNFPGVILGDRDMLAKLDAFQGSPVDGHAPGVRGTELNAYVAGGPRSDHESTSAEEATEKLRRGLVVFLREASNARNLDALLPALTADNRRRVALCTDDRHPPDLLDEGGIDAMVRRIIEFGVPPVEAIRMATLNTAEYFGLSDRGAVAPGRVADLLIVDELETLTIREVWCGGTPVARDGRPLRWELPEAPIPPSPRVAPSVAQERFRIDAQPRDARAIEVVPDQIVTRERRVTPTVRESEVVADPGRDLLKIAVVERHKGSGRIAVGLVLGMGLERGAMAGTVAHDHHNVIAVGADDRSLVTAVRAVMDAGGGLAVADGTSVLATLPLPVGGLMSTAPIEEVRADLDRVVGAAHSLGSKLDDPFMAMSFLGLEVIPSLKITDRGLVDVDAFRIVDLWV